MYDAVVIALRIFGGLALSVVLGVVGLVTVFTAFFFSDSSWPQLVFIIAWYSGGGIGAGVGSYIAWMNLESSWIVIVLTALVIIGAGLTGAWAGYYYEAVLFNDNVPFTARAISNTALFGGIVAANIVGGSWGVYKHVRYEMLM